MLLRTNIPNGNFPTVKSPNPEEPAALELALAKQKKRMLTSYWQPIPMLDRVGIAVKDNHGKLFYSMAIRLLH